MYLPVKRSNRSAGLAPSAWMRRRSRHAHSLSSAEQSGDSAELQMRSREEEEGVVWVLVGWRGMRRSQTCTEFE